MKIIKVTNQGKLDLKNTIRINTPVIKSYKKIKQTQKRMKRDASLLKALKR